MTANPAGPQRAALRAFQATTPARDAMTARDDPRWSDLPYFATVKQTPYTRPWTADQAQHLTDLFDEVDRLRAQVEAVRDLHRPGRLPTNPMFCHECELSWPCRTARALVHRPTSDGGNPA